MSEATLIKVADAMVAEVVAGQSANAFTGYTFEPIRSYATFSEKLNDEGVLHVDLVPFKFDVTNLASRDRIGYDCSVDIFIRKRFNTVTDRTGTSSGNTNEIKVSEIDKLVKLVQVMTEFFIKRRLTTLSSAAWKSSTIVNAYSSKHLQEHFTFIGWTRTVFAASEDAPR